MDATSRLSLNINTEGPDPEIPPPRAPAESEADLIVGEDIPDGELLTICTETIDLPFAG